MKYAESTNILRSHLVTISALQSRIGGMNAATVREYVEALEGGHVLPPIKVVRVNTAAGPTHYIVDGFHRVAATKKLRRHTITAEIADGTRDQAVMEAARANATHGLKRSRADKRRAVEMVLASPLAEGWSSRQVAAHAGVSHTFANAIRTELSAPVPPSPPVNVASPDDGAVASYNAGTLDTASAFIQPPTPQVDVEEAIPSVDRTVTSQACGDEGVGADYFPDVEQLPGVAPAEEEEERTDGRRDPAVDFMAGLFDGAIRELKEALVRAEEARVASVVTSDATHLREVKGVLKLFIRELKSSRREEMDTVTADSQAHIDARAGRATG